MLCTYLYLQRRDNRVGFVHGSVGCCTSKLNVTSRVHFLIPTLGWFILVGFGGKCIGKEDLRRHLSSIHAENKFWVLLDVLLPFPSSFYNHIWIKTIKLQLNFEQINHSIHVGFSTVSTLKATMEWTNSELKQIIWAPVSI